jgi:superfamily II DNA helicase RecQ
MALCCLQWLLLMLALLVGLVVVVSPLLSLMHDQVSRLPPCLPGAMLQGNMTKDEVQEVK